LPTIEYCGAHLKFWRKFKKKIFDFFLGDPILGAIRSLRILKFFELNLKDETSKGAMIWEKIVRGLVLAETQKWIWVF